MDRLGDEDMQNRIRIAEPWAILGHLGPLIGLENVETHGDDLANFGTELYEIH